MDFHINNGCAGARRKVLVIGAGVAGLTSALCLRRRGFDVAVVADRFAPRVTSVVAGALWEWPPAVCGHHHDPISLARAKLWCAASYDIFAELARDPATGVFLRPVTFYFEQRIEDDPRQQQKMVELQAKVRQFRRDPALLADCRSPNFALTDAYAHLAPMIDTDVYMQWLHGAVQRAGCCILERKITGALRDQAEALAREFRAEAIVHCTGLGARELADDTVYPVRGALIRVHNDGKAMPRITQAHCISQTGSTEERGFLFIVPRGDDMLILGGFAEPHEWQLDIGFDNCEPVRAMYRRCVDFLPVLEGAVIDAAEPVRVGLRPFRRHGVRVETEPGTRIVHNYGHGGSGVTLSWGCAQEVVERVEQLMADSGSCDRASATAHASN
jgi:D-amino-acid oxidase